jgi:hypothetical protein
MNEEDQIDMMHDSHALWQEIDRLRAELAQRTAEVAKSNAERDEARRDACVSEARYREERDYPLDIPREEWIQRDARSIAAERGWNCFAPHANTTDVPVQNGGEA